MPSDWDVFARTLLSRRDPIRTLARPHPRSLPWVQTVRLRGRSTVVRAGSYGSSDNFDVEVRVYHPEVAVPESHAVLVEGCGTGWPGPAEVAKAAAKGGPCPLCKGTVVPPGPGEEPTHRYCDACGASGFGAELADQLRMAGLPAPEPAPAPAPPSRPDPRRPGAAAAKTRRQARADRYRAPAGVTD
jgi:hypothetical protein